MTVREPFGYVVKVEGAALTLNVNDTNKGQVAAHADGVSSVTESGALVGIASGDRLFVARVRSLYFSEPREAHRLGVASTAPRTEPLRHIDAAIVGYLSRRDGSRYFVAGNVFSPALGSEAFVLSQDETEAVLAPDHTDGQRRLELGRDARTRATVRCSIDSMLPRHVAVLGSTGQGKSCFTATVLQQLAAAPGARIVVFDVNGEYERALADVAGGRVEHGGALKVTKLGGPGGQQIPYYALGRAGLFRLLMPSERTQAPALTFALENLPFVKSGRGFEAGLVEDTEPRFFDDCRSGDAGRAWEGLQKLRQQTATPAATWPHMGALAALCADSHCVRTDSKTNKHKRDSFEYGAVGPLITRIRRRIDDPRFKDVVDVRGSATPAPAARSLDWQHETDHLAEEFFGSTTKEAWRVHIVDLRALTHDLMPFVLGALLEMLADHLFRRGQASKYPTLLVLEEAHHYLRGAAENVEEGGRSVLAYERLAKEGRKFGLSLWISTQRPSEVSSTVLGQCGTWAVFRLSSEQDRKAVLYAADWGDRGELDRIAGLPRQQAVVFGAGVPVPVRIEARRADPAPDSHDSNYETWWT